MITPKKRIFFIFLLLIGVLNAAITAAESNKQQTRGFKAVELSGTKTLRSDVYSLAYSADSKYIAGVVNPNRKLSVGNKPQNRIIIWDAHTGKRLAVLEGHTGIIWSVAFHPTKPHILASGSEDKTVRLWDIHTHKLVLPPLTGHKETVSSVAFDKTGEHIISASKDRTIKVWNIASRKRVKELTGHKKLIAKIAVNGDFCASASWDNTVKIYRLQGDTAPLLDFAEHKDMVFAVDFNPKNADMLASGSSDKTVMLWSIAKKSRTATLASFSGKIWDVKFSPDGKFLAVCPAGGPITICHTADGTIAAKLSVSGQSPRYVEWSPDGKRLAAGYNDASIRLWDAVKFTLLATMAEDHNGQWISFTPEGYFTGSDGAFSSLKMKVSGAEYLPDQIWNSFYDPVLVSKKIEDGAPLGGNIAELMKTLVPSVKVDVKKDKNDKQKALITVAVTDEGAGIGRVNVKISGRTYSLSEQSDSKKGETKLFTFEKKLPAGNHKIYATAFDKNNRKESRADAAKADFKSEGSKNDVPPRLWLCTIACNEFPNLPKEKNLATTVRDADNLMHTFKTYPGGLYSEVRTEDIKLRDTAVTKPRISVLFDDNIADVKEDDVFVLFLAGHGVTDADGKEYYFVPSDYKPAPEGQEADVTQCISGKEWRTHLENVKAHELLVIMDTCHSGAFITGLPEEIRSNPNSAAADRAGRLSTQKAMARLGRGFSVITATTNAEEAIEGKEYKSHGVFTACCLDALKGAADANKDSVVSVGELAKYLEEKVPVLAADSPDADGFGHEQHPQAHLGGADFALTGPKEHDQGRSALRTAKEYERDGKIGRAKEWYKIAAQEGSKEAAEILKQLEETPALAALPQATEKAVIEVNSELSGVVYLNNENKGNIAEGSPLTIAGLEDGAYTLEANFDAASIKKDVSVAAGDKTFLYALKIPDLVPDEIKAVREENIRLLTMLKKTQDITERAAAARKEPHSFWDCDDAVGMLELHGAYELSFTPVCSGFTLGITLFNCYLEHVHVKTVGYEYSLSVADGVLRQKHSFMVGRYGFVYKRFVCGSGLDVGASVAGSEVGFSIGLPLYAECRINNYCSAYTELKAIYPGFPSPDAQYGTTFDAALNIGMSFSLLDLLQL